MEAWLDRIFPHGSVAGGLAILSLAIVLGLFAGAIKVRGVSLGVAAVMFVALGLRGLGLVIDDDVLGFMRDFALVLFVYSIGLQVGPGFLSSLRAEGLRLNLLALAVVVLGAVLTAAIVLVFHLPRETTPGLYTGGFATTPALAAGEEALRDKFRGDPAGDAALRLTSSVYAAAYPFGLLGPIILLILFRRIFRIDVAAELKALREVENAKRPPIEAMDFEVTRKELDGVRIRDHALLRQHNLVLSRLLRENVLTVPSADTVMRVGDVYRMVGSRRALEEFVEHAGQRKPIDVKTAVGDVERVVLIFTHKPNLGRTLREMDLTKRFGVTIARISRAGVQLTPTASLALRFGDTVTVVGPCNGVRSAEAELGNSIEVLNRPQLIPIFLGIGLGILVGSIPLALPGLHSGIRIGLAGGPMLVAILLSQIGNAGRIVFYLPDSASLLLRDFGMAVFLACVGLRSGEEFFGLLFGGNGLALMAWGALVTLMPMLLVGLFARLVMKLNYVTLCGLTAGAMTSSPTLIFANDLTDSNVPSVAYAAVYPLAMLVPVFCTQLLVTFMV
ncbi:MAG TPA: putative transporter [Tepidisphaeraceae bacterium]|nr:putative transporter [Tepidisphaeraceae bacterium]